MSERCPNSRMQYTGTDPRTRKKTGKATCKVTCMLCRGAGRIENCSDCQGCGLGPGGVPCKTCNTCGKVPAVTIQK